VSLLRPAKEDYRGSKWHHFAIDNCSGIED